MTSRRDNGSGAWGFLWTVKIPSPAGWDVPIILQGGLSWAPSQIPLAVMESNLPLLLRTRGWGG